MPAVRAGAVASARYSVSSGFVVNVIDTFDRADSPLNMGVADTGQAWGASSGNWNILDNQAYCSLGSQSVVQLDAGAPDVDMTVDVTLGATVADVGLVLRWIDNNNYLLAMMNYFGPGSPASADSVQMYKRDGGTFTQLATTSVNQGHILGATYELRFVANGAAITAYRNGVSIVTHTLSVNDQNKFTTPTRCGLRQNVMPGLNQGGEIGESRFNNLLVIGAT